MADNKLAWTKKISKTFYWASWFMTSKEKKNRAKRHKDRPVYLSVLVSFRTVIFFFQKAERKMSKVLAD